MAQIEAMGRGLVVKNEGIVTADDLNFRELLGREWPARDEETAAAAGKTKGVCWEKGVFVLQRCRLLRVCLFLVGMSAFGQLDRGTITGVVTDPTDAVVSNATITVTNVDTNVQSNTVTTQTGNFTVAALLLGRYRVQVQAAGFKISVRDDVIVSAGSTVRLDVKLELGEATQRVEVAATIAPLASDSTRVATNITNKLVDEIPLVVNGQIRSVFDLATLTPDATTGVSGLYRVAGGQDGSWDMQMDGSSVTPTAEAKTAQRVVVASAPIDAISEFAVDSSSGMKAEYGRAVGMINFVTKSGTDQYHGDAYEFLRNDALDARGFFAASKPRLQQHDFGATVGGPVYLPRSTTGNTERSSSSALKATASGKGPSRPTTPFPPSPITRATSAATPTVQGRRFQSTILQPQCRIRVERATSGRLFRIIKFP